MSDTPPLPATSGRTIRPSNKEPVFPDDGILISNIGVGKRSEAFHWLMLGHNVYDSQYRELTVRDLERNIDPHDIMNPIYVRGALWKTVPRRFWLADRGDKNGPEPAQPGLNPENSGEYYGCQLGRTRQRELPRMSSSTTTPQQLALHPRPESPGTVLSRPSQHILSEAVSKTSPFDSSLVSSNPNLGTSFTSTGCAFAPRDAVRSPREAREVWTTKGSALECQNRDEAKGFVHGGVEQETYRARLDSFFEAHSDFSEREICKGSRSPKRWMRLMPGSFAATNETMEDYAYSAVFS